MHEHLILGGGVDRHAGLRSRPGQGPIVVVVHAVDEEQIAAGLAPVGAVLRSLERAGPEVRREARNELQQRVLLAPLRRQVLDLLRRNVGPDLRLRDLDERRLSRHRHLIGQAADRQREVERDGVADEHCDARPPLHLEASQFSGDRVATG
jgi:hypothetical protein